jgi:outer membrane protein TolC
MLSRFTVLAALSQAVVTGVLTPTRAETQTAIPASIDWVPTNQDPLAALIADAWRNNGLLESARHTEAGAAAHVREARALYLPALNLQSRFSELRAATNLGDFVNPAYKALNQVTGTNQFPTNIDFTLPRPYDSNLRLSLPLLSPQIWANRSAAGHLYDAQRFQRLTVARHLAADVQLAWLVARSGATAVKIHEAALELVKENLRVTRRRVDAGTATPDGVFRAQAELSDAEQKLIEARDGATQAARVVNQLAGRPLGAPLDSVPDSLLIREIPIGRDEAVAGALVRREELAGLESGTEAAGAEARAARASYFPNVSLAVDYGFQGSDPTFSSTNDYAAASIVLSWNLFNGGGDAARVDAALAGRDALEAQHRDLREKVQLDVLQTYDAAVAARQAMAASDDQLAAARQAYRLVSRRYEESSAPQIELIDARSALTAAELNRAVTLYSYAQRLVELERAAALRAVGP